MSTILNKEAIQYDTYVTMETTARGGWNGKNMWLKLQVPDEHSKMTLPYIYIEYPAGHPAYPNGSRVPWLASQTDILADDWVIVE